MTGDILPPNTDARSSSVATEEPTLTDDATNTSGKSVISRVAEWFAPRCRHPDPFELPREKNSSAKIPADGSLRTQRNFLVLGNCQARALATSLQSLCPSVNFRAVEPAGADAQRFARREKALVAALSEYDGILTQSSSASLMDNFPELVGKVMRFPYIGFAAYHPDLVYIKTPDDRLQSYLFGPLGQYNSAIALWGYLQDISVSKTLALFNAASYEVLDYHNFWQSSCQSLLNEGVGADIPLGDHFERWRRTGCFMHSVNHPKINVFIDVAKELLKRLALPCVPEAAEFTVDEFADGPVWPVYPEVAQRLGVDGHYRFKIEKGLCAPGRSVVMLDLREFVEGSFEAFGQYNRGELHCDRMQSGKFEVLRSLRSARTSCHVDSTAPVVTDRVRRTPYSDLPVHQFWKDAVALVPWQDVDPVVHSRFQLARETKIATAGSCFAQNISTTLKRYGFNYFVTERDDNLPRDEAQRRLFGIYSARYGNVYTARQLLQLFERAYGRFSPVDSAWLRSDGRYIDPFRPLIEPDGFDSAELVGASASGHLGKVRELFEQLDVFIFTLGLTEAWRSRIDGAVFPSAPGVVGGAMDCARYEFANFNVGEVVADLQRFTEHLRDINPDAQMILTVSPVPLIATYESQHALVATTYSKSVLRAAAGEICARNQNCAYFPSYEIITGNYSRGAYYESDLRTVTAAGIDHVMRLFLKHYAGAESIECVDPALVNELNAVREIVCDEQALER